MVALDASDRQRPLELRLRPRRPADRMRRRVELAGGRRRSAGSCSPAPRTARARPPDGTSTARRSSRSISRPAHRSGRSSRAARATTTSTSRARPTCSTPTAARVVGLGGKDGVYYALDRETGKLVWKATVAAPRVAVDELLDRRVHRRDRRRRRRDRRRHRDRRSVPVPARHHADTGAIDVAAERAPRRRSRRARSSTASRSRAAPPTSRCAPSICTTGKVLWSQQLAGGVAGGVAVSRRARSSRSPASANPASQAAGTDSGVYAFELGPEGTTTTTAAPQGTLPPTTDRAAAHRARPERAARARSASASRASVDFTLKAPPPGTNPTMTVHLQPQPFRIEVRADGSRRAERVDPHGLPHREEGRGHVRRVRVRRRVEGIAAVRARRELRLRQRRRAGEPTADVQPHQHPRDREHARRCRRRRKASTGSSRPIALDHPVSFK